MGFEQDTLIYIDDKDKMEASVAANSFAHKDVKNRAYINTLGAELAMKYLASENIDISDIYNIHSIKKILEELDISDIMLPNIHIDVRVVFDENVIFVPKSHFEYNLVPDIYIVFFLAKDLSYVKFLGFFEPKLINKNNANDKYYFIEKEKLSSALDLKKYIENHKGNTKEPLSETDLSNSERIIISMADNDISEDDKKYLIKQLTKSAELRDRFIEYENFEALSYKAMTDSQIHREPVVDNLPVKENVEDLPAAIDNTTLPVEEVHSDTIDNIGAEQPVVETQNTENQETPPAENLETIDMPAFEDLQLEPVDNLDNLLDDTSKKEPEKNLSPDIMQSLADAGMAASAGAIAVAASGAAMAAAAEVANAMDTAATIADAAANTLDTAAEIADLNSDKSNTVETPKTETNIDDLGISDNLLTDETASLDSVSFDDIDVSTIDNTDKEEKYTDETVSFDSVEIPKPEEAEPVTENPEDVISFDNVDMSSIDNIKGEEKYTEETLSLDDVKMPEVDVSNIQEPVNSESGDMISLDNVDTTQKNDESSDTNPEEETIFLDDVDISGLVQPEDTYNKQTVSLADVDTSSLFNDSSDDATSDLDSETISLDDVDTSKLVENETMDKVTKRTISISDEENSDLPDDFKDDVMSFDDNAVEPLNTDIDLENISIDEDINAEPLDEEQKDITNSASDIAESPQEPEIVEDTALTPEIVENTDNNSKSDGFGKNLVDNLSSDNMDDISIEDLGDLPSGAENISSTDLMSQIDDLLSSSADDTPVEAPAQAPVRENTQPAETLDDVPDISELDHSSDSSEADINALLNFVDNKLPSDEERTNQGGDNISNLFDGNDNNYGNNYSQEQYYDEPHQQVPGAALYNNKPRKSPMGAVAVVAVLAVIAAASALMFLKPKNDAEPIVPAETSSAPVPKPADESNVLESNTPDITQAAQVQKPQAKELKNNAVRKSSAPSSYLSVNRLVWDVPGNLSYSKNMQSYLRTAAKSIKLSLSADLLLATEYAYTNQVKVNLKVSRDGTIQDANIASSSGSTQIDNIVLQSVKDTLNAVKPPSSEIKTPDFNLSLIIYF